jgi:hypothetical protein
MQIVVSYFIWYSHELRQKYVGILIVFNPHKKVKLLYLDGDFTSYFNVKNVHEKLT